MAYTLSDIELRVVGALMEKQITTPDHYPLTLKSLVAACNQKSNREPVMNLDEATVRSTVDALESRYLVSKRTEYGSRAVKHRQRFCNTEFGALKFSPGELAIMTLLMLRGAQTPGELRSRSARMHAFESVDEVAAALDDLGRREDGPFVVRLAREPGKREARYMHCLGEDSPEEVAAAAAPVSQPAASVPVGGDDRVARLEARVDELSERLDGLAARIEALERGQKPDEP